MLNDFETLKLLTDVISVLHEKYGYLPAAFPTEIIIIFIDFLFGSYPKETWEERIEKCADKLHRIAKEINK